MVNLQCDSGSVPRLQWAVLRSLHCHLLPSYFHVAVRSGCVLWKFIIEIVVSAWFCGQCFVFLVLFLTTCGGVPMA